MSAAHFAQCYVWQGKQDEMKVRTSFFEKKEAKKLLLLGVLAPPSTPPPATKSFLLLFFKKEVLSYFLRHTPPMPLVTLHPVRAADAAELIAANLASKSFHAPFSEPFTDQPGFDAWFATLQSPANASFLIRGGASGALAGIVNFSQIFYGNFCSAYTGFYANAALAGTGLTTAGLKLAAAHAFTTLRLHRLEANIQPANTRSLALVQRVGFQKEGFSPAYLHIAGAWRDHERWALLAPEP
jgi:ribosomal-protein-alanine N-acetyltransferase